MLLGARYYYRCVNCGHVEFTDVLRNDDGYASDRLKKYPPKCCPKPDYIFDRREE